MGRRPQLRLVKALLLLGLNSISASLQDQHCESLSLASNVSGLQCNASVDLIGTCWPQSPAGQLVVRPCPAYFYGVRYNTTNNGYRECLANGTWAARVNYSECQEILSEEPLQTPRHSQDSRSLLELLQRGREKSPIKWSRRFLSPN